jgi:hypothetical protein
MPRTKKTIDRTIQSRIPEAVLAVLQSAMEDDEPLTADELEQIEAAERRIASGAFVDGSELRRRLA